MPRGVKYLILIVLLISFTVFAPGPAAAEDGIIVIMSDAYYADVDGDGMEDDIVVKYQVISHDANSGEQYTIELYCTLTLPSGQSFVYEFAIVTSAGCNVTQYWFDAATESGWYEYSVYAYLSDASANPGYDEIIFDPPGGTEGDPLVDVVIVELEK